MNTNIAAVLNGLDTLRDRAIRGAETGLAAQTGNLISALRATSAHGDVTGATRAGYTAGVAGPTLDTLTGAVRVSAAEVAHFNPGHSQVMSAGSRGAAEVVVILTCASDYQAELSGDNAGAKDALKPTLHANAQALARAAANGIRGALR